MMGEGYRSGLSDNVVLRTYDYEYALLLRAVYLSFLPLMLHQSPSSKCIMTAAIYILKYTWYMVYCTEVYIIYKNISFPREPLVRPS